MKQWLLKFTDAEYRFTLGKRMLMWALGLLAILEILKYATH